MFKDPFAFLAIFDELHNTRDDLKAIERSIATKASSVEHSADRIDEAIQRWNSELKELGTKLGRDVHDNGYAALELYVNDRHKSAIADLRQITTLATTEWRALATDHRDTLQRQLEAIAAAANGLPPLPPRPVAPTPLSNCAYIAKLSFVHARRFVIEASSFAILLLAVASAIAAVTFVYIAMHLPLGPISFPSFTFR